jgi:hypothetical protein
VEEDPDLIGHSLLRDAVEQRWEGALALATIG